MKLSTMLVSKGLAKEEVAEMVKKLLTVIPIRSWETKTLSGADHQDCCQKSFGVDSDIRSD